ncbi:MAG: ImmA/IrrE family metallo-endopeptidase [Ignavibacteria bacterium]|nr:ImmA/IrrE family metallo-endopeptidase [Ignavibacteria bacterium]
MYSEYKLKKELLSPPGDTIQETIDTIGMNQYELAERLGKNIKNVNQIIKGKEPITTSTAIALEKVLGIPADFWIERDRQYQKEFAEIEFDEYLENCKDWIKHFPIANMVKLGWIPASKNPIELLKYLLNYFGIASPEQWSTLYISKATNVAFKISLAHTSEPEAISVWLRKGEIDAKKLQVKEFNKDLFKKNLEKIKELSFHHPADFKDQLQKLCSEAGVAIVYTPNIPKATISSATRWIFNTTVPLIQLSGRYKTNDHFWFTFFHEAGHILLHGKKDVFLEEVTGHKIDKEKEVEADRYASKFLIPDIQYQQLLQLKPYSESSVLDFANKQHIHPAIVVGRLQHDDIIPHNRFNDTKIHIDLFG